MDKTKKQLGIWMDHSRANLMDASNDKIVTNTIKSEFTPQERQRTLGESEHVMHNAERHEQHEYYKQLGDIIKGYDSVVVFGPTKAKEELINILKEDKKFNDIKIEMVHSDKMTENQQHAFVKNYFVNN